MPTTHARARMIPAADVKPGDRMTLPDGRFSTVTGTRSDTRTVTLAATIIPTEVRRGESPEVELTTFPDQPVRTNVRL